MRTTIAVIAASLGILTAMPVRAATPDEIIDRAIAAQAAKPEDLAKRRVERILLETKSFSGGDVLVTREVIVDGPDRLRYNNIFANPQSEQRIILVLNRNRVWRASNDIPYQEQSLSSVDEFRAEAHGRWVGTLIPLKDKSYTLTALLDSRFEGEDVHVLKVSKRFRPDVLLFFSKKSGLLVRVSYKTTENGVPVRKEHVFSEYRKFDGLTLPGRMVDYVSGNKMADYKVKEYKFLDKQPEGIFEKADVK
jgi:hypothetical protein